MAEVSNLHLPREPTITEEAPQQEEQAEDTETLDSVTYWCTHATVDTDYDDYASDSDPFSLYLHHHQPPLHSSTTLAGTVVAGHLRSDSDSYSDSDSESCSVPSVNCFVTDLFEQRRSEEFDVMEDRDSGLDPFSSDLDFRFFEGDDEIGANDMEEDQLELGLDIGIQFDGLGESSGLRESNSHCYGLRVVGFGSDSDTDSEDVDGTDLNSRDYGDDGYGSDPVGDLDLPLCWDCLRLDDQRTVNNDDFEWEEVDERVDGRESLSMVIDDVVELSVSSISSEEGAGDGGEEAAAARNLEWEVLLAVNNLERNMNFEGDGAGDVDANSYLAVQDDYIYAEYETLFGQFVENESALKGSPPAAKTVVDSLPVVALTQEDLQNDNVVCAVCKDDILLEEKVKRLPCCHYYHGDCIVPWLSIRNTCPVCRFELPTDDPDYERRKIERAGGHGLSQDLETFAHQQHDSVAAVALTAVERV